jgi:outer membrane receptor for ferrienterochelin and colicin
MFRTTTLAAALGSLVFAAACASTGGERRAASDTSVITQEEIEASHATNAYDLVQTMRPRWLSVRGQSTLGTTTRRGMDGGDVRTMVEQDIPVFVDGSRFGGMESLRNLATRDLARMQRLSTGEATQRWGTGFPNGAILIITR